LTSASCVHTEFTYEDYYLSKTVTVKVKVNNFHPTLESIYSVYVGVVSNPNWGVDLPHVELANIEKIIIHEGWNQTTNENNIAIIKLLEPLELNRYVQIACLPNVTSTEIPGRDENFAYIAGLGNSAESYIEEKLNNKEINLYNGSMCDFSDVKTKDWERNFCAGEYNTYGNETSEWDYGGAVYSRYDVNGKKKYVATGLLSYDTWCETLHSPAVYVRISYYLDWILKNSKY
ncbi:unnamed protein product, partial [Brachionus calyciflorus]